jgi:thioredoxin reductase (NADPH)
MIGARPHTGWLPDSVARDEQGFLLTGADVVSSGTWPLERAPLSLETSLPGVFAAGDARHSAVRRVASAVGEGSVAVQLLHRLFELDDRHPSGRPKAARESATVGGAGSGARD